MCHAPVQRSPAVVGGSVETRCGAAEGALKTSTATMSDTTTQAGIFVFEFPFCGRSKPCTVSFYTGPSFMEFPEVWTQLTRAAAGAAVP